MAAWRRRGGGGSLAVAVAAAAAWRQRGGGCGSLAAVAVVAAVKCIVLMCQKHRNILIPTYATINKGGNLKLRKLSAFVARSVPYNPTPKRQHFPHTISISAMATPLPIPCSNCRIKKLDCNVSSHIKGSSCERQSRRRQLLVIPWGRWEVYNNCPKVPSCERR